MELIPFIDYSLCKGCGACAEIYPVLFVMREEKAWVIGDKGIDEMYHAKIAHLCAFGAISFE